jgi:hypothetical protein
METLKRTRFQGVSNILRFNWHFYLMAFFVLLGIVVGLPYVPSQWQWIAYVAMFGVVVNTLNSLLVSYYVYDYSGIYGLDWLNFLAVKSQDILINIHAGFDETSGLLQAKYPTNFLRVFDFYNPSLHTEIAIRRARKAYPPYPTTEVVATNNLPLGNEKTAVFFLLFAAHEIRNFEERVLFFRQLAENLQPEGKIIVVEHLRDVPNFLAYTIGFFHFYAAQAWRKTFAAAQLTIHQEFALTPFVKVFVLELQQKN